MKQKEFYQTFVCGYKASGSKQITSFDHHAHCQSRCCGCPQSCLSGIALVSCVASVQPEDGKGRQRAALGHVLGHSRALPDLHASSIEAGWGQKAAWAAQRKKDKEDEESRLFVSLQTQIDRQAGTNTNTNTNTNTSTNTNTNTNTSTNANANANASTNMDAPSPVKR